MEPLLSLMQPLNGQIAARNDTLEQVAQQDAVVANLCTTSQVGPVTARAFGAAVDNSKPCCANLLRKTAARTVETLCAAIDEAIACLTPEDAQGWFAHCGYSTPAQPS